MIRSVQKEDLQAIIDIYAPYVLETAISFEIEVPTLEAFQQKMEDIIQYYPFYVVEEDGEIKGYAYAHMFYGRDAYYKSVEVSIYLKQNQKRNGYGRLLYEKLEESLKKQGIENLYVCIAYSEDKNDPYVNNDSLYFHQKMGYQQCGHFHRCGYKFDRYYDTIYMEKHI